MGICRWGCDPKTDAQTATLYCAKTPVLLAEIDRLNGEYIALPELRCTFAGRSVVPNVAVVAWSRIQTDEAGEIEDNFGEAPDWTIEILSSEQRATRVIDNILYCLRYNCRLGWLVDPGGKLSLCRRLTALS